MTHKLAFIGFGVVGQGFAENLHDTRHSLRKDEGFEAEIVAISDFRKGSLYHPEGLDIEAVVETVQKTGSFDGYPKT